MDQSKIEGTSAGYQILMLALSVYAIAVLAAEATVRLDPEVQAVFNYADYGVCGVFVVDFLVSLWRAPKPFQYFVTWGWLDLLSSIPMLDAARWGRLARVVRVLRVLRGLRATRLLTTAVLRRRAENSFLTASLLAVLLLVFCSIAVLQFERLPESNIKTADDAMWWAVSTITTVGYGDRYPVTTEGRIVAAVLMCSGVGLFSIFSGLLAAWLLTPPRDSNGPNGSEDLNEKIDALRKEIAELRDLVKGSQSSVVRIKG